MVKEIIQQWEQNKHRLEEYFRTTQQGEYDSYKKIVRKIFELCLGDYGEYGYGFDVPKLRVIDDGGYQGTQIFIIPLNTCQPDVDEYLITDTYYGSCSGCDTLAGIMSFDDELPTEGQVKGYMTLALHLVQKMRFLSR